MDAEKQLKNLKDLLSEFVSVVTDVNVLHESAVSKNEATILPTKSCTNLIDLDGSACGLYSLSINGNGRSITNLIVSSMLPFQKISPTKSCTNPIDLGGLACDLHSVSIDHRSTRPITNLVVSRSLISRHENEVAIDESFECGFDFVLSGNGNANESENGNVSDGSLPILPNLVCTHPITLSNSTCGLDFVSSENINGNNGDCRNVSSSSSSPPPSSSSSVGGSQTLRTKSCTNPVALGNSMCGSDFIPRGNGNDNNCRNVYSTLSTIESETEQLNVESDGSGFGLGNECGSSHVIAEPTPESTNKLISTDLHSSIESPPTDNNASAMPKKKLKRKRITSRDNTIAQPHKIDIKRRKGCDNAKMFVPTSDGKAKKLCCAFCLIRYENLARHLETHKDEEEVKKMIGLKKGSKNRRSIISTIRKRGQFLWNTNENLNGGELSTSRRPNKKCPKKAIDFNSCANCLGSYTDSMLRKHWNECTNNSIKGERIVKQLSTAVEGRIHANACEELTEEILPGMRQTPSLRLIRFDWLVIEFGNDLCLNYSPFFQRNFIRKNLRETGKLLFVARSVSSKVTDFASIFHVTQCNTVIEAIQKVSRFDLKAKKVGSPSTASALRTLVNKIGELLVIESMKVDDFEQERNVERFLKVFNKEARLKISKLVASTQSESQLEKDPDGNIPKMEDISRLAAYLNDERDKAFTDLSESYSYEKWLHLSKLTMVSILQFNRKRAGEMQNIKVVNFQRREMIAAKCSSRSGGVPKSTTDLIKSRMRIRGKLANTVPVLLKHCFDDCIELLMRHRVDARIPDKNIFLFALATQSGNIKVVDAGAALRTFSKLCGAENPTSLTGTKLRKHMATHCGTLGLQDNDVTNVAKFMGHSEKIHRDIYRHNPLQREVVQMTELLQSAQGEEERTGASNVNVETEGVSMDTEGFTTDDDDDVVPTKRKKKPSKKVLTKNSKNQAPKQKRGRKKKQGNIESEGFKKPSKKVVTKTSKKRAPEQMRRSEKKQVNIETEGVSMESEGFTTDDDDVEPTKRKKKPSKKVVTKKSEKRAPEQMRGSEKKQVNIETEGVSMESEGFTTDDDEVEPKKRKTKSSKKVVTKKSEKRATEQKRGLEKEHVNMESEGVTTDDDVEPTKRKKKLSKKVVNKKSEKRAPEQKKGQEKQVSMESGGVGMESEGFTTDGDEVEGFTSDDEEVEPTKKKPGKNVRLPVQQKERSKKLVNLKSEKFTSDDQEAEPTKPKKKPGKKFVTKKKPAPEEKRGRNKKQMAK